MIKTAIVPVAGLGTRMLPATKAIPKEMLPVVDKPIIQYIVEECAASGIENIVLVTHSSKNSIEDHFDVSFELESTLEKRVKRQLLNEVRSITPPNISIMHIRQGHSLGLGHAVLTGKKIVGDNDFVVVLPDVLINRFDCDLSTCNLTSMIKRFDETGASQLLVEEVDADNVDKYGIVDVGDKKLAAGETAALNQIIEKPKTSDAPSNLAVVGRYVFSKKIWAYLAKTPPGLGGEIQLTDAISDLIESDDVEAYKIVGKSHDCGDKQSYFATNLEYTLRSERYGKEFTSVAEEVVKQFGK